MLIEGQRKVSISQIHRDTIRAGQDKLQSSSKFHWCNNHYNHVTLPAHIPEPVRFLTHAPIPICCVAFLWCTLPNTCPRLGA